MVSYQLTIDFTDVRISIQVRRAVYDKGVDFWMLGILIYELFHGSTPFEAETEMNTYEFMSSPIVMTTCGGFWFYFFPVVEFKWFCTLLCCYSLLCMYIYIRTI